MTWEETEAFFEDAPLSWLPGLLILAVKTAYTREALYPGGAVRIVRSVEAELGIPSRDEGAVETRSPGAN